MHTNLLQQLVTIKHTRSSTLNMFTHNIKHAYGYWGLLVFCPVSRFTEIAGQFGP